MIPVATTELPGSHLFSRSVSVGSENPAPGGGEAIWRAINGALRSVSSPATDDAFLPDNNGYSSTPLTDLIGRDIKGTFLSLLSLPNDDDHARQFNEVVRRIPEKKQPVIMEKITAITPGQLEQINQCCLHPEKITTEFLDFLQSDDFAYAALRAFREEKISRNTFATLVTLQGVYLERVQKNEPLGIQHFRLFDKEGEVNKPAWDLIARSLARSNIPFTHDRFDVPAIIPKMKLLLKQLPPVEAGFWKSNWPISSNVLPTKEFNMEYALRDIDFMVLYKSDEIRLCPSISLRQAFVDSFSQEEAHKINPVIGISTPADIRTGDVEGHRDMAIPFPGHPLPKTADHLPVPDIVTFMHHDFYHVLRASLLKNSEIPVIVAFGDVVNRIKQSCQREHSALYKVFQERGNRLERPLSEMSARQQGIKEHQEEQDAMDKAERTLQSLKQTRKALGQLAFNLYDLETHLPTFNAPKGNSDSYRFRFHLENILFQMYRYVVHPWGASLSETEAGIVGQCIIPTIPGNLANPREIHDDYCRKIDSDSLSSLMKVLSKTQKQQCVAMCKKFIETLNPSVKPDRSQWPAFLREDYDKTKFQTPDPRKGDELP